MRIQYQEALDNFLDDLSLLGNSATESMHKAVKAFRERDKELAHEIISDDLRINALTVEIEQEAYRLIALQQPVASDLRKIFAILLASTDFERMADHATSIAKAVIRRSDDAQGIEVADSIIERMAEIVGTMMTDSITAFVKENNLEARQIAQRDMQVDALFKQMHLELPSLITGNQETTSVGIGYLGIASNLERIGDYVTNICERIVFVESGEIVDLNT